MAFAIARDILAQTTPIEKQRIDRVDPEDPYYDPAELYGIIPSDWKNGISSPGLKFVDPLNAMCSR